MRFFCLFWILDLGCASKPSSDHVPMWELVYGDCIATAPFIDKYRSKQFQNHTLLLGGLTELPRFKDACDLDVYDVAMKQHVIRDTVGTCMLNYRKCGTVRESIWKNCQVIVNRKSSDDLEYESDFSTVNHLGLMYISNFQPDGLVIVCDENNFSIDGAASIQIDDKLLVKTSSGDMAITRSEFRWFIRNKFKTELIATITTRQKIAPKGLEVQIQQAMN